VALPCTKTSETLVKSDIFHKKSQHLPGAGFSIPRGLHDIMLYQDEEVDRLGRPGAFKSEKRKKELSRLKKQEEKRQRRFNKAAGVQGEGETVGAEVGEKTDDVQAGDGTP
jgi:hypothetical protein